MENEWGVNYVTHTERRCGRRTFNGFAIDVALAIPDYKLYSVQMSGTDANAEAISMATDGDMKRCLFAIGSYVGGDRQTQMYSTSGYSARQLLAMPQQYFEANPQCQEQTVPLPYHIQSDWLTDTRLRKYEKYCLDHLHETLLFAFFSGRPYKAILLEYILGGNGAELSCEFLTSLSYLLKLFGVVVIADEVLTGGRVGPGIAMTTNMPREFQKCVEFITLGKFMGCGLVLQRKQPKPVDVGLSLRGFSTSADCGLASKLLEEVVTRINAGLLEERHELVLRKMNCSSPATKEDWWGHGLLLFFAYKRPQIKKGLKSRALPRLEKSKLMKLETHKTDFTRSVVCKHIVECVEEWVHYQHEQRKIGDDAFLAWLVEYLLSDFVAKNESIALFRAQDVIDYMGKDVAEKTASTYHIGQLVKTGRRVGPSPDSLIKRAIVSATSNTKDSRSIYKKRLGNKRVEFNLVDGSILSPCRYEE